MKSIQVRQNIRYKAPLKANELLAKCAAPFGENTMPTTEQIKALAGAMSQLLDDMGPSGQGVCLAAKAQARIAYEPFADPDEFEFIMTIQEALRIISDVQKD